MMTGQRTFELIPTSLVKSNGQRRPMTSKAAKKAYQQANRGPKVSRAEQRRRDNAELEQQKREYEKERAAARAKAAREKKAAKANTEKDARRKQGLPEPSRFVRPSQSTISRFVRSEGGNKRTWQQMESLAEDSDRTISDAEQGYEGPSAKRQLIDEGSDDEFGDFPAFSQLDVLEQIASSELSVKESPAPGLPTKSRLSSQKCRNGASQELPKMEKADEDSILNTQALDDLVTTQLLSDLVEAVTKSDSLEPPDRSLTKSQRNTVQVPSISQPSPRRSGRVAEKFGKAHQSSSPFRRSTVPVVEIPAKSAETMRALNEAVSSPRNDGPTTPAVLQTRSTNMPPPCLPPKVTMATKPTSTPQKPHFPLQAARNLPTKPVSNLPPSSTQAFLESHMDDFFPSPTQAVRDLLDDLDDIPSNTQVARELNPENPGKGHLETMFSTQDFILSPEDLVDIISPRRSPSKPLREATSESLNRRERPHGYGSLSPKEIKKVELEDFISTQDLVLSPVDLEEIISSRRTPQNPLQVANPRVLSSRNNMDGRKSTPEKTKIDDHEFMNSQELAFSPVDLEKIISSRLTPLKPLPEANPVSLNQGENADSGLKTSSEKRRNDSDFFMSTQGLAFSPGNPEEVILPRFTPPKPFNEAAAKALNEQEYSHVARQRTAQDPKNDTNDLISSQKLVLTPVDLEKIVSPRRTCPKPLQEVTLEFPNHGKHASSAKKPFPERPENELDEFVSTQDLILSPEDLNEIHSSPHRPALPSPPKGKPSFSNHQRHKPSQARANSKRRFFEEKDEDLYYAAIHESKAAGGQAVPIKPPPNNFLSANRNRSDSTDYGDFDSDLPGLFEDKEDEELEAAIRESKITAELEAKRLAALTAETEQLELERVLSNSTDYGDFDLLGLSEEHNQNTHRTKPTNKTRAENLGDIAVTGKDNGGKAKPRRFFEEKYEDQMHAAIYESRTMEATKISIMGKEVVSPNRFFKEKYEDQVHAAVCESERLAMRDGVGKDEEKRIAKEQEKEKEKRKAMETGKGNVKDNGKEEKKDTGPGKEKRKMKRILSAATDYGDDDFMDCELELVGMC
ncbi:uncharacterized protein RSE6_06524 [Rhynchosporium secalis]|uniref:Uncharacterized protein n=1 Tax=Rhynchosporium secalis TaxID=38038 RepID=A0A1E1MAN7_RHYSE|nr:uncharacterized protein RSE6_06524 [Rhynchosporium secalis]